MTYSDDQHGLGIFRGNSMDTLFLARLEPVISRERLTPYRNASASDLDVLVSYLFNLTLSEALYSPLGCLEVSLRNSIDATLRHHLGTPDWYNQPGLFAPNQMNDIQKAKKRATPSGAQSGSQPSPGKVVAELNFGFWTSLLSNTYEASLWRPDRARLLKRTFPHVPRRLRQRNTIYANYNHIRELRNRVFHHESIWNRSTLEKDYQSIIQAIGWISPEMQTALAVVDRFEEFFQNGRQRIERDLEQELNIS